MKTLKFIWLMARMIFFLVVGFNFVPGIFVAVAYFRGKLINPHDWQTPYATGFSVGVVILVAYFIHSTMKSDNLPY
jgi:hypothetical protein